MSATGAEAAIVMCDGSMSAFYHETVRLWWNRFDPMFAADIRPQRVSRMRGFCQWR